MLSRLPKLHRNCSKRNPGQALRDALMLGFLNGSAGGARKVACKQTLLPLAVPGRSSEPAKMYFIANLEQKHSKPLLHRKRRVSFIPRCSQKLDHSAFLIVWISTVTVHIQIHRRGDLQCTRAFEHVERGCVIVYADFPSFCALCCGLGMEALPCSMFLASTVCGRISIRNPITPCSFQTLG